MFKVVANNKKAFHDYEILEKVEAGIVLTGTEVKSLRRGSVQIRDSYAWPKKGELWLMHLHISQYTHGNMQNHEPMRARKLLLHKKEMAKWVTKTAEKHLTIVPLKIYFKGDYVKVELGLGRGKKHYDKREKLKSDALKRDTERQFRIKH